MDPVRAGALSKALDSSKVVPLLLDLQVSDLTGPLAQFQATLAANKESVFSLVKQLEVASDPRPMPEERLRRIFDRFWPGLEEKITALQADGSKVAPRSHRSERDILEEIITLVRRLDQRSIFSIPPARIGAVARQKERAQRAFRLLDEVSSEMGVAFSRFMTTDDDTLNIRVDLAESAPNVESDLVAELLREKVQSVAADCRIPINLTGLINEAFPPF